MVFFENWEKKRAIKTFLLKLPDDLAERYGSRKFYTAGQVESTIKQGRYPKKYIGYALVSFLSEDQAIEKVGSLELVRTLRKEVSIWFFNGNEGYVLTLAKKRSLGDVGHGSNGGYEGGTGD